MLEPVKPSILHYRYIVLILALIIISLLTFKYAPDTQLFNYVSFAATISSLILAVLAIIQGFYSNNAVSETVANMNTSSREIVQSSVNLEKIINGLDSKIQEIPTLIKGIETQINTLNTPQISKPSGELPHKSKGDLQYFYNSVSPSGLIAVYMLYLSHKSSKIIDLNILEGLMSNSTIDYFYGFIISCHANGIVYITIPDRLDNRKIKVVSFNETFLTWPEKVKTYVSSGFGLKFADAINKAKMVLDDYFTVE